MCGRFNFCRGLRQLLFAVVFFVVSASASFGSTWNGSAEEESLLESSVLLPASKGSYARYNFWNQYAGELYLSGGFSQEFNYGSVIGGKAVLDYMVSEVISVGVQSALYAKKKSEGGAKTPYVGIRLSYQILEAKWRPRQNHWNIYAGISAEVELGAAEKDWHEKRLLADFHLGLRYRLSETWFIWSEAAMNNATIGLSVAL